MVFTTSDEHGHEGIRQDRLDDLLGALLVLVVEEGEQEGDDHRIHAALGEQFGRLLHLVLVERNLDSCRPAA